MTSKLLAVPDRGPALQGAHKSLGAFSEGISFAKDGTREPYSNFDFDLLDGHAENLPPPEPRELRVLESLRELFSETSLNGVKTTAAVLAHQLGAWPETPLCALAEPLGVSKQALQQRRAWLLKRYPLLRAAGARSEGARDRMRESYRRRRQKTPQTATNAGPNNDVETGGSLD